MKIFVKIIAFVLLLALLCVLMCSCKNRIFSESYEENDFGNFSIVYSYTTKAQNSAIVHVYHMYDKETKIMYYFMTSNSGGISISPMLDQFGTPYKYDAWLEYHQNAK